MLSLPPSLKCVCFESAAFGAPNALSRVPCMSLSFCRLSSLEGQFVLIHAFIGSSISLLYVACMWMLANGTSEAEPMVKANERVGLFP